MSTFDFNEAGFLHFLTDTNGNLARTLEGVADAVVVAAQENVGRQRPGWVTLNAPPGPPYRRTGDLQNSIRATPAIVFGPSIEVNVIADAAHRGFPYPIWLRSEGYEFVDLASFEG